MQGHRRRSTGAAGQDVGPLALGVSSGLWDRRTGDAAEAAGWTGLAGSGGQVVVGHWTGFGWART